MTLLDITETKLDTTYREGGWSFRDYLNQLILQRINPKQWNRIYVHPQSNAEVSIKEMALI